MSSSESLYATKDMAHGSNPRGLQLEGGKIFFSALAMSQVTDGLGRPAQYRQASRKGKKAWRKNIDLSATEAALEDLREQERAEGVPAHKRSNAELFMEDRSGQETTLARQAREKRKLKSQEILAHRSAVPAMLSLIHI